MVIISFSNFDFGTLVGVHRKLGVRRQFFKGYQDFLPEMLKVPFVKSQKSINNNQKIA